MTAYFPTNHCSLYQGIRIHQNVYLYRTISNKKHRYTKTNIKGETPPPIFIYSPETHVEHVKVVKSITKSDIKTYRTYTMWWYGHCFVTNSHKSHTSSCSIEKEFLEFLGLHWISLYFCRTSYGSTPNSIATNFEAKFKFVVHSDIHSKLLLFEPSRILVFLHKECYGQY